MKKLSSKTLLIAIISFAVWHFWKVEQERQRQQLADTVANQPFDVICATADLDVGTVVTPEMIVVREFPCCKVPADIIWDPSVAVGRKVKHMISAGEMLSVYHFGLRKGEIHQVHRSIR